MAKKPRGYWNKEHCMEDAARFESRSAWDKASGSAYNAARKNGWMEDCCVHMTPTRKPVGYWGRKRCIIDAGRFESRSEWSRESASAYGAALKNGWLEYCCQHMDLIHQPNNYWTKERCKQDAERFDTRSAWSRERGSAYAAALNGGWLDDCCQHMRNGKVKHNIETCKADAMRFRSISEWRRKSQYTYNLACKNGWVDYCCDHAPRKINRNGYWTKEMCIDDASRFESRSEWARESASGYKKAFEKGWLEDCCRHMVEIKKPNGYWTKEKCVEDAALFSTRAEWSRESASAYVIAHNNGWLDDCCGHMETKMSDYDAAYIWEVDEEPGTYKIGITSQRLGDARIMQVAGKANLTPRIVGIWHADDALSLEHDLHELGEPAYMGDIDGKNEFRRMDPVELQFAVGWLDANAQRAA